MVNHRQHCIENIMENMESFRHAVMNAVFSSRTGCGHEKPLTPSQWAVLMAVTEGGHKSIKGIAGSLNVSSSAVTQSVNELVNANFLVRRQDENDRRSVIITVSPEFKQDIAEFKEHRNKQMAELCRTLSNRELEEFDRITRKILDNVTDKEAG